MECPTCDDRLRPIIYEGIQIETCDGCGGEWLDSDELGKIVRVREVRFDAEARRAIAESTTITGVRLSDVDRDLQCPKCGGTTDAFNYGGDTGIILDRCISCNGFWMDGGELEKVQKLIEGWDDQLPEDLNRYGPMLRDVAAKVDERDNVQLSRYGWVNAMINGILDLRYI